MEEVPLIKLLTAISLLYCKDSINWLFETQFKGSGKVSDNQGTCKHLLYRKKYENVNVFVIQNTFLFKLASPCNVSAYLITARSEQTFDWLMQTLL